MKARDPNIDFMRLMFMFCICLIHSVGYLPSRYAHWLSNLSYIGVVGFVLISGYFGIKFSLSKVLRLELYALICAGTVVALANVCSCGGGGGLSLGAVIDVFKSYWFVHAYILVMCLSPLAEKLAMMCRESLITRRDLALCFAPVFIAVFVWSFSTHIWGIQRYVPRTEGLSMSFSGMALFAAYLVGVLSRVYEIEARIGWIKSIIIIVVCVPVVSLEYFCGCFARYDSVFVVALSVVVFVLLRRIRISPRVGAAMTWLSPSVLAVYLYHCNPYGYELLGCTEAVLSKAEIPLYLIFVLNAAMLLIGGLVLDVPRRISCMLFSKPLKAASWVVDSMYNSIFDKFVR
jgi:surface polysaccharide O-acyltransferase-like enzyme